MALRSHPNLLLLAGIFALASCAKEQPHSVAELIDNPRLLEATVVRCAADRAELKYTDQCINAREASERLAVREKEANRSKLEAESARKREALRRSREAAGQARQRAEEAERLRQEAIYLDQFEELPQSQERDITTTAPPGAAPEVSPDGSELPPEPEGSTLDEVRDELRRRQQAPDE